MKVRVSVNFELKIQIARQGFMKNMSSLAILNWLNKLSKWSLSVVKLEVFT